MRALKDENKPLLIVGIICAVGCLFIAIYNSAQAAFLKADVIPASEYNEGIDLSDEPLEDAVQSENDENAQSTTININTATAEELAESLPGIGEVKARHIVEYREASGGFDSVDELINVSGIGEKTLEKLRPYCRVTD